MKAGARCCPPEPVHTGGWLLVGREQRPSPDSSASSEVKGAGASSWGTT